MKVVDMHCDTIYELLLARDRGEPASLRRNSLHIDLEKLRRGDYLLQNFAMFVNLRRTPDATAALLRLIDLYHQELAANADLIAPVLSYADIERNAAQGRMSALLTIEEGAPCQGDVRLLRDFYRLGARMMTLTWNFENDLAWPNNAATLPGYVPGERHGLKPAGFEIVAEMRCLGMIVDVSHLSDDGFYDVCSVLDGPFVASHSNARAVCDHPRNLTDGMIRALADHGGVMGVNFYGEFLSPSSADSTTAMMVRHIQHIVNIGGIDCVGLGTDFDGIESRLEIADCSQIQLLADALSRQGFSSGDIEKIFSQNVLRVYKDILK